MRCTSEHYRDFLKTSPEWAAKRKAVLARAKGCCERCCEPASPLFVHHLTYKARNDVVCDCPEGWLPSIVYLIGLCEDCHEFLHGHSQYDPCNVWSLKQWDEYLRKWQPPI